MIIMCIYKTREAQRNYSPLADQCPVPWAAAATPARSCQCYLFFTWYHMTWKILLACLGQLSRSPSSLDILSPLWQNSTRKWNVLCSLYSTAQQHLKHQCTINTVFLPELRRSIKPDRMRGKKTTVLAETRKLTQFFFILHIISFKIFGLSDFLSKIWQCILWLKNFGNKG